jgi:hypothetical protein
MTVMNDASPAAIACDWCAQDVALALGGEVDNLGVLAPKEGHSDKDRSLRVMIGDWFPDGYFVCSAYDNGGEDDRELLNYVLRSCPFLPAHGAPSIPLTDEQLAERAERTAERARKRAEEDARKRTAWRARWVEATPHTDAERSARFGIGAYLSSRKVGLPPNVFRCTRFTNRQALAYGMMAEIVAPSTGEPFAFHITYLDINGRKTTWREGTDRITPGMTSDKGVGKLIAGVNNPLRSLCVGEGIETALSFAHLPTAKGATIWAGVNSANMAQLPALDDFDAIMIAVDCVEKLDFSRRSQFKRQ